MPDSRRELAWHHLRCPVPVNWEVTAYSIERRVGRMELSNRHGLQALYSWEPCRKRPDPDTTMKAFLQKLYSSRGIDARIAEEVRVEEVGPWRLARASVGPARALWFHPGEKMLLSWVFEPTALQQMDDIRCLLLKSTSNDDPIRKYRIHGVHACMASEFDIEAMHVQAANVMIHFESSRRQRAVYRRWGMPEFMLQGRTLEEFLHWALRTTGMSVSEIGPDTLEGMPAVRARFAMKPVFQLDKYMGRRWKNGDAWLWHDEKEARIYSFEQIGPPKLPKLDLYACNPDLRHGA